MKEKKKMNHKEYNSLLEGWRDFLMSGRKILIHCIENSKSYEESASEAGVYGRLIDICRKIENMMADKKSEEAIAKYIFNKGEAEHYHYIITVARTMLNDQW